jgi:phosphonate transport system substrate-binding protein
MFLFIVLILSGCNNNPPAVISTPTPQDKYKNTVKLMDMEPLKFAFVTTKNKLQDRERWQNLTEFLTAKTGIPIDIEIFDNEAHLLNKFSVERIDMAFVDGLAYIKIKNDVKIIPILRTIEDGSQFNQSYIIVRKDSGFKTLANLKNRKISFTDNSSASGYLYPRILMAKSGIKDIEKYFSRVDFTGDDFSSFLAVYNGYVDAGIISRAILLTDDKRLKEIKIIMETDLLPHGAVIVRNDLESDYVDKLKSAFLQIGKTVDTRELTKAIQIDCYVEASDSDYDDIRENLKVIENLEI